MRRYEKYPTINKRIKPDNTYHALIKAGSGRILRILATGHKAHSNASMPINVKTHGIMFNVVSKLKQI